MEDAIRSCEWPVAEGDIADDDPTQRIFAGASQETSNLTALEQWVRGLELLLRTKCGEEAVAMGERARAVHAYIVRLHEEGQPLDDGFVALTVDNYRIAGIGRRFAWGPSQQRLCKLDLGGCSARRCRFAGA